MIETALFYLHHGLTLLWGVILSAAFCGVRFSKKTMGFFLVILLLCGSTQVVSLLLLGEAWVWRLYPVIVHIPLGILLSLFFRKRFATVLASVSLAYLCCQPSKWLGFLTEYLVTVPEITWMVRIIVALVFSVIILYYFAGPIANIFSQNTRIVLIFCSVPVVYYLFDYTFGIYTDLWAEYHRLLAEFLAFVLCGVFMVFCTAYHREYEKKNQIQQKNQLIELTVQQQAKEIEAIRKTNLESNLLRHDMRHLLSNLALSLNQNDKDHALSLISGYISQIESTTLHRYCPNDTVNYILTNFESKCHNADIQFHTDIHMEGLPVDEVMFSSILSNGLDNAFNAQMELPQQDRQIWLMLKDSDKKLLLSVKNSFHSTASHEDYLRNIPAIEHNGHGYGTQSILYMTEKLGGKCQFAIQNDLFILRVIL